MDLVIQATDYTPDVSFNLKENKFEIQGVSRPENVLGFYKEIFDWISSHEAEIVENDAPMILEFKLTYFNTTSAKYLSQLLLKFNKIMEQGKQLVVNWYYQEGDDKTLEDGEDLAFSCDMDINFLQIELP